MVTDISDEEDYPYTISFSIDGQTETCTLNSFRSAYKILRAATRTEVDDALSAVAKSPARSAKNADRPSKKAKPCCAQVPVPVAQVPVSMQQFLKLEQDLAALQAAAVTRENIEMLVATAHAAHAQHEPVRMYKLSDLPTRPGVKDDR